ncbi:hypothetical protein Tco_0163848 [Tanacetum coccineum]
MTLSLKKCQLFEFVDRLVASPTKRLYYVVPGTTLTRGIREITSDDDMAEFVKVGFENGFKVDLYHEYNDYDVMAYTTNDNLFPNEDDNLGDDETVVEQEKYPENIDFHTEGEENVVLEKLPIDDPFLTKLVGRGNYIGTRENPIPPLSGHVEEVDPQDADIDPKFKAQTDVQYPSYNPDLPWKEFMPVLGMKFDNPQQLKHALADYGVANGYQLWYYRSDGNSLLVYCGRDVEMGRCAGRRVIRKKKKEQQKQKANGKGVMPANQSVQPAPKIKWTRMRVQEHKAASTIEQDFTRYIEQTRQLDPEAYRYLMEREPERWSKAYFQTGRSCASFENGISESFDAQIIDARGKPIISMLEDIRVYIMQRNWSMSKLAATLNDNITPSIRKHLEELKEKQRK